MTFEVKGVKGGSCLDETKFLEEALGGEILESASQTGEYYEQAEDVGARNWAGEGEAGDD